MPGGSGSSPLTGTVRLARAGVLGGLSLLLSAGAHLAGGAVAVATVLLVVGLLVVRRGRPGRAS